MHALLPFALKQMHAELLNREILTTFSAFLGLSAERFVSLHICNYNYTQYHHEI